MRYIFKAEAEYLSTFRSLKISFFLPHILSLFSSGLGRAEDLEGYRRNGGMMHFIKLIGSSRSLSPRHPALHYYGAHAIGVMRRTELLLAEGYSPFLKSAGTYRQVARGIKSDVLR